MIGEAGGFAASLDADSEGEEGKFYVWSAAEIEEVLGAEDAAVFARVYGVTADGNFEGHNILNRLDAQALLSDDRGSAPCRDAGEASRAPRLARPPRLGRQDARRLERADDRRAGARRQSSSSEPDWLGARRARLRLHHGRSLPPATAGSITPIARASRKPRRPPPITRT